MKIQFYFIRFFLLSFFLIIFFSKTFADEINKIGISLGSDMWLVNWNPEVTGKSLGYDIKYKIDKNILIGRNLAITYQAKNKRIGKLALDYYLNDLENSNNDFSNNDIKIFKSLILYSITENTFF